MTDEAVDVVEFLLTVHAFNETPGLDAEDLPSRYRRVFWTLPEQEDEDEEDDANDETRRPIPGSAFGTGPESEPDPGGVERPLASSVEAARTATGVESPWEAVASLPFTQFEEFTDSIELADLDMACGWFHDRGEDRIASNPTIAHLFGSHDGVGEPPVTYEEAREAVRPLRADRVWIDGLLRAYFSGEDDQEMLDLVEVRAPEEVETTLDDLVLTDEQDEEVGKVATAIEHRDYLAEIGLREVGKLLFVGPPGTGKTSVARALAHDLDLPTVEVKLSMITSQYLGETAKNVEKTFEVAKRLAPCVLFIDEFDFVAKTRRGDEHAAVKRAVNTLLKAIDNISLVRDDVLLIGATNHPDQLDSAAWRRFDEIVHFPRPDHGMRADILRVITEGVSIDDFDPEAIADVTEGMTGSDLRLLLREAVLEALTEGRTALTGDDFRDAVADFERRDTLKTADAMAQGPDAILGEGDGDGGHDHAEGSTHPHPGD
jgi:AAA+ superfamily predicted ATPase